MWVARSALSQLVWPLSTSATWTRVGPWDLWRHRYARASWDKKISANEIAFAMGQTIDVHLANYARFKPSGTADSYRRAAED